MAIKIGPIGARFNGAVTLSDLDPPNGYTITGEGQGGTVGSAKGGAKVRLTEANGGTLLSYDVDAQVGGRLAQLGGPIIDATAKQLAGKFFEQFGAIVGPVAQPAAASTRAPRRPSRPSPGPCARHTRRFSRGLGAGPGRRGAHRLSGRPCHRRSGQSDWMGLAIGLLLMLVAAAAFEYGRRSAAPVVMLDAALLARLAAETKP